MSKLIMIKVFERLLTNIIQEAINANLDIQDIQDILSRAYHALNKKQSTGG